MIHCFFNRRVQQIWAGGRVPQCTICHGELQRRSLIPAAGDLQWKQESLKSNLFGYLVRRCLDPKCDSPVEAIYTQLRQLWPLTFGACAASSVWHEFSRCKFLGMSERSRQRVLSARRSEPLLRYAHVRTPQVFCWSVQSYFSLLLLGAMCIDYS